MGQRLKLKVENVAGRSIRYEMALDDQALMSADIKVAPAEGGATRLAAEIDMDMAKLSQLLAEEDVPLPLPTMAQEGRLDMAFSHLMG